MAKLRVGQTGRIQEQQPTISKSEILPQTYRGTGNGLGFLFVRLAGFQQDPLFTSCSPNMSREYRSPDTWMRCWLCKCGAVCIEIMHLSDSLTRNFMSKKTSGVSEMSALSCIPITEKYLCRNSTQM